MTRAYNATPAQQRQLRDLADCNRGKPRNPETVEAMSRGRRAAFAALDAAGRKRHKEANERRAEGMRRYRAAQRDARGEA